MKVTLEYDDKKVIEDFVDLMDTCCNAVMCRSCPFYNAMGDTCTVARAYLKKLYQGED